MRDILSTTNALRNRHHALPLAWDDNLARYAAQWVAKCDFHHSNGPYGENLALGYADWPAVVQGWYNEVAQYDFAAPGFGMATGHFTALVWKGSERIGCAERVCDFPQYGCYGCHIYACEFDPPGNVEGEFPANVVAP